MSATPENPETLSKLLGKKVPIKVVPGLDKVEEAHPQHRECQYTVDHNHYIGIEVEVEGIHDGGVEVIAYPVWMTKEDGSLRNNGVEFVSHPVRGKRVIYALNWLFANLNKEHSFSPRTSIHIHLNVLDLTLKQIATVLLAYTAVEKLLYRFVGGGRDKNNFCVPFTETTTLHYWLKDLVTNGGYWTQNIEHLRYLGLNLSAIKKFGTLEFRHLGGTSDMALIIRWINLLGALKTWGEKNTFEDTAQRLKALNTDSNYRTFIGDLFGNHAWYITSWDLKKDMEYSVSVIKKILAENTFALEQKKLFNPKTSVWCLRLNKTQPAQFMYIGAEPQRPQPARPQVPEDDLYLGGDDFDEEPRRPAALPAPVDVNWDRVAEEARDVVAAPNPLLEGLMRLRNRNPGSL